MPMREEIRPEAADRIRAILADRNSMSTGEFIKAYSITYGVEVNSKWIRHQTTKMDHLAFRTGRVGLNDVIIKDK